MRERVLGSCRELLGCVVMLMLLLFMGFKSCARLVVYRDKKLNDSFISIGPRSISIDVR